MVASHGIIGWLFHRITYCILYDSSERLETVLMIQLIYSRRSTIEKMASLEGGGGAIRQKKCIFCSVLFFKLLLCSLCFFSVIFVILSCLHDIHPLGDDEAIPTQTVRTVVTQMHHFEQTNKKLVAQLRDGLIGPSKSPYTLNSLTPSKEHVLEREVRQLLAPKRGFFVEVGAADGEYRSPTLCLETDDGWTGLLIEPDPRLADILAGRHRKSYVAKSCVSFTNYSYIGFMNGSRVEPIDYSLDPSLASADEEIHCYPLYTHLLAVGKTSVDFLVINTNGRELEILRTLPWTIVDIKIIALIAQNMEAQKPLNKFFGKIGYTLHRSLQSSDELFFLFVKR